MNGTSHPHGVDVRADVAGGREVEHVRVRQQLRLRREGDRAHARQHRAVLGVPLAALRLAVAFDRLERYIMDCYLVSVWSLLL